jgi:hypothetical protein
VQLPRGGGVWLRVILHQGTLLPDSRRRKPPNSGCSARLRTKSGRVLPSMRPFEVGKTRLREIEKSDFGWSAGGAGRRLFFPPIFAYLFDFRRINIVFLFCRTKSLRALIFV